MEQKKTYPEAKVSITTEEYRDLIAEATECRKEAEYERDRRWKAEGEVNKLREQLALAEKKIAVLENELERAYGEEAGK